MFFNQRGSTLLVSLILILIFTVVGMASVSNVGFNQKMSSNYRDADLAFHAAEAVLREGEDYVEEIGGGLLANEFSVDCDMGDCFTADCVDGRCFSGTHEPEEQCIRVEPEFPYAEEEDLWNSARVITSELQLPGLLERPKYFVEFMCYVTRVENATIEPNFLYPGVDWSFLFRVTSYAQGANGTSRVMLQSTYKVDRL